MRRGCMLVDLCVCAMGIEKERRQMFSSLKTLQSSPKINASSRSVTNCSSLDLTKHDRSIHCKMRVDFNYITTFVRHTKLYQVTPNKCTFWRL